MPQVLQRTHISLCIPHNNPKSGGRFYYYPHFTDEKMQEQRLGNLPITTQLIKW